MSASRLPYQGRRKTEPQQLTGGVLIAGGYNRWTREMEYGDKQMEVGVPEAHSGYVSVGNFRSSGPLRASLKQSSFCGVSAGTSWYSGRMDAQRNRTHYRAANCLEMSLGANMNETLFRKEFGVEEEDGKG